LVAALFDERPEREPREKHCVAEEFLVAAYVARLAVLQMF
jgi:hypothetical protein